VLTILPTIEDADRPARRKPRRARGEKEGKSEHLLSHVEGNAACAIKNILNPVFPLSRLGRKTALTCACSLPSRRYAGAYEHIYMHPAQDH
jgi:hypothetical protein